MRKPVFAICEQPCRLICAFVVRCLDTIIPLVSISKISSLYLASVAAQASLSLTWSQTPKTGFLVMRLVCFLFLEKHGNFLKILIKYPPYLFLRKVTLINIPSLSIDVWYVNWQLCLTDACAGQSNLPKERLCQKAKYSSVFRENRCPQPPKPVYGGNFNHEAITLIIRSRSPKYNKLLVLSNLYKLANLLTFHPMIHEITCRQTLFGLHLVDEVWQ